MDTEKILSLFKTGVDWWGLCGFGRKPGRGSGGRPPDLCVAVFCSYIRDFDLFDSMAFDPCCPGIR